jgi:hypothetical protein
MPNQSPPNTHINTNVASKIGFDAFYRQVFLPEHQHPYNRAAHVFGTLCGLIWLVLCALQSWLWPILLFPVVHAAPGLVGHRFFERNAEVGDVRVTRKDYSPLWFILANHRLSFEMLLKPKSLN